MMRFLLIDVMLALVTAKVCYGRVAVNGRALSWSAWFWWSFVVWFGLTPLAALLIAVVMA